MKLTTNDLKKSNYGTACGTISNKKDSCLSQPIIINYIDDYFGGEFLNVELEDNELCSGSAKFSKEIIDSDFYFYIDYLSKLENKSEEDYIKELCNNNDISYNRFAHGHLHVDDSKELICLVFSLLVDSFDGSLRVDFIENDVEIESE